MSLVGGIIKISRFLRFATFFPSLKEYIYAYYRTLFSIGGVLFNLAFFMVFYAILGMHLFKGLMENRCRIAESPPKDSKYWQIEPSSKFLCGDLPCPEGSAYYFPKKIKFLLTLLSDPFVEALLNMACLSTIMKVT